MRRVARGCLVFFGVHNQELNASWWLHDYFPATGRLAAGQIH
jgi:hypothetical protein